MLLFDFTQLEETPLFSACRISGSVEIVKLLVAAGANLKHSNRESRVPLHVAAENGNDAVLQLLIESGGNMNTKDEVSFITMLFKTVLILLCSWTCQHCIVLPAMAMKLVYQHS